MPAHHTFEYAGHTLHVEYDATQLPLQINSVRLCGADYTPTGPDIQHMLDTFLVMETADTAVSFLSLVTESIYAEAGTPACSEQAAPPKCQ